MTSHASAQPAARRRGREARGDRRDHAAKGKPWANRRGSGLSARTCGFTTPSGRRNPVYAKKPRSPCLPTKRSETFLFRNGASRSKIRSFPIMLPVRPPENSRIRLSSWGRRTREPGGCLLEAGGDLLRADDPDQVRCGVTHRVTSWLPVMLAMTTSPVWETAWTLPR